MFLHCNVGSFSTNYTWQQLTFSHSVCQLWKDTCFVFVLNQKLNEVITYLDFFCQTAYSTHAA